MTHLRFLRALVWTVLMLSWATAPVAAQASWSTDPDPAARLDAAMVHDPVRGVTVLYGGTTSRAWHDTWEWDGAAWHAVATVGGPQLDVVHGGAFDPVHQRVVVVGTPQPATPLQVWSFDGAQWTQLPSPAPTTPVVFATVAFDTWRGWLLVNAELPSQLYRCWRFDGAAWSTTSAISNSTKMAFDPVHGVCVLTWGSYTITHDGTSWNLQWSVPPNVVQGVPTWDARRQRIVMMGCGSGAAATGLWTWDGATWNLDPMVLPRPRARFALCFDGTANGLLVAGGARFPANSIVDAGTWEEGPTGFVWRDVARGAPSAGRRPGVGHDGARDRLVVFGGTGDFVWSGGLYVEAPTDRHFEWDRMAGWSERTFATRPSARSRQGMVFDAARARMLLFGGLGATTLGDTWTFDGSAWTQHVPATAPSARSDAALCYDEGRQVVVLYGGRDQATVLRDTWEWNGSAWTQRVLSYPPADEHVAMAYDPRRQRSVLVTSGAPGPTSTWLWDGSNWQSQVPPAVRPVLSALDLVYDRDRARLVLIGRGPGGLEVWDETLGAWSLRAQDAARDRDGAATYDPVAGRIVFLGGRTAAGLGIADVDAFAAVAPARFDSFGTGCAAGLGVPALSANGLPWLGDTIQLRVEPVAATALAWIDIGFSDATWQGTPLPFELTAYGAQGCWLWSSAELGSLAGGAPQTQRTLSLLLPNAAALAGYPWFAQAVVFDAAAGTLRTSAGRRARLGGR